MSTKFIVGDEKVVGKVVLTNWKVEPTTVPTTLSSLAVNLPVAKSITEIPKKAVAVTVTIVLDVIVVIGIEGAKLLGVNPVIVKESAVSISFVVSDGVIFHFNNPFPMTRSIYENVKVALHGNENVK